MTKTIIYIEKNILQHPAAQNILKKFPHKKIIPISQYTEIFNKKKQCHKQENAFILAHKYQNFVHKNPAYCVCHLPQSYYFSTSLNCPFDCEYCFLPGMYQCSYPLFFINNNDFKTAIKKIINQNPQTPTMFFSGYDNDSLALDHLTNFSQDFIPWFQQFPNAYLELRTKSTNLTQIKKLSSTANTILSWTLSPIEIQEKYEKKTSSLEKRIQSIKECQKLNWKVGIRLEPILYLPDWQNIYKNFFQYLKKKLDFSKIENIYFGIFKIPKNFLPSLKKQYPISQIFHQYFITEKYQQMTYSKTVQKEITSFIYQQCLKCTTDSKIFYYHEPSN